MGLKGFHIVFIIASIILSAFFAFWAFMQHYGGQNVGYFVTGVVSTILTIGLVIYLVKFNQKLKSVSLWTILVFPALTTQAQACTACFYGSPEEAQNKALSMAVIALLAFLVVIMGLFIKFIIGYRKRSSFQ